MSTVAVPQSKCCCYGIPGGAKGVLITEAVFVALGVVGAGMNMYAQGTQGIVGGILNLLFYIALVVTAYLLLKSTKDVNPSLTLPYCILKIIHLIFQGVWVVVLILGVIAAIVGTAIIQTNQDEFNHDQRAVVSAVAGVGLAALILFLTIMLLWFVLGIICCVTAFKIRTYLKGAAYTQGGMALNQPAYAPKV